MIKFVEEFNKRYGRRQDRGCRRLKHNLAKLDPDTGGDLLKGFSMFGPTRLKVIIPNCVNAPSNCLASSSSYSACCIGECEALIGHIERKISAPEATPDRIAEVVSTLPSTTVQAPRELSTSLRSYLDEIAVQHGA